MTDFGCYSVKPCYLWTKEAVLLPRNRKIHIMYDANVAFATHYQTLLTASYTHTNSNDFGVRVTAREAMSAAESKLAFARRHITFDVRIAAQTAMMLKAQKVA